MLSALLNKTFPSFLGGGGGFFLMKCQFHKKAHILKMILIFKFFYLRGGRLLVIHFCLVFTSSILMDNTLFINLMIHYRNVFFITVIISGSASSSGGRW